MDEESRGRSGRPAQPFDTPVYWDPGLTIAGDTQHTNFSLELPIQIPSDRSSVNNIHLTNRSDSASAPVDDRIEKILLDGKAIVVQQEKKVDADEKVDDDDLDSLPDLKHERTNDSDCSGA